jgi:hypothetical protein
MSRQRDTWQRPILFAAVLVFAIISSACDSSTPVGLPSCTSANLCFGVNSWTNGNTTFAAGTPQGMMSNVYLRLLYCDSSCQAEKGFIANYIMLGDAPLKNWFQIGFRADGANNGDMYYYYGYTYNGTTGWVNMAPVNIATDIGNYLNFGVNHVLDPTNQFSTNSVELIYANPYGAWSSSGFVEQTTTFAPSQLQIGLAVHGTHGEAADSTVWLSNRYGTAAKNLYPVAMYYPNLLGDYQAKAYYGAIFQQQPPYARWLGANIFNNGDGFIAYCCKP